MPAWEPYPLLFEPILKPRVWGGDRLALLGRRVPAGQRFGESWELADLPPATAEGGESVIANGPQRGMTLRALLLQAHVQIMGSTRLTGDGRFPLLIKYLDAAEPLSVQVHPSPACAVADPDARCKSEAWVILDAERGARLYIGLKPHVNAAKFKAHIESGAVVDDLVAIEARVGDCHYLPSGICHALGAGIMVAEVQTPSDTTFRVYDWGRTERELHIDEALACIDFEAEPPQQRRDTAVEAGGLRTTVLCECEHFRIERIETITEVSAARSHDVELPIVTSNQAVIWMMLRGSARIGGETGSHDRAVELSPGDTVLLPAALEQDDSEYTLARIHSGSVLLRITSGSPTRGMLA